MKTHAQQLVVIRTAAIAGLSLLLAGRIAEVQHIRRAVSASHGRYTLDQILQRSLPLCGALTADCASLRLTGAPMSAWSSGMEVPIWMIDGVDPQGKFKVHMVWDAGDR